MNAVKFFLNMFEYGRMGLVIYSCTICMHHVVESHVLSVYYNSLTQLSSLKDGRQKMLTRSVRVTKDKHKHLKRFKNNKNF